MAGATRISYDMTGGTMGDLQEELMTQSALQYALYQIAQKKMAADGKAQAFAIRYDSLRRSVLTGAVAVTPAPADAKIYRPGAIAHRAGDVIVSVVSPVIAARYARYGLGERYLLWNLQGGRARPIDITLAVKQLRRAQAANTEAPPAKKE
jgi:hypothetical protein